MDLYRKLSEDHEKARATLRKVREAGAGKPRDTLFAELKRNLEAHAAFEEAAFYPAIAEDEDSKDAVDEALAEHDEATALLEELHELDKGSEEFMARLGELEEALEHHIQEEENELFRAARETISAERAGELARQFDDARSAAAASG